MNQKKKMKTPLKVFLIIICSIASLFFAAFMWLVVSATLEGIFGDDDSASEPNTVSVQEESEGSTHETTAENQKLDKYYHTEFHTSTREEYRYDPEFKTWEPLDLSDYCVQYGVEPKEKKPYTLLVYIVGTNLETPDSDHPGGAASDNISDMLKNYTDNGNMNLLFLVGGTEKWVRPEIPDRNYGIYQATDSGLKEVCDLGTQDMGDPALVGGFIQMAQEYYPSDRTAIIFWDHGGGCIHGFGHDELTDNGLSMQNMGEALEAVIDPEHPLDFVGFDACLMATLENACVFSPYADYLIASEESEPGSGWRYSFIETLCKNPTVDAENLGKEIVDDYIVYNNTWIDYFLDNRTTLSVVDLKTLGYLTDSLNEFSQAMSDLLQEDQYPKLFKARYEASSYGNKGNSDASYDLVDLADMADKCSSFLPVESRKLKDAVAEQVIYSASDQNTETANGLTIYFPCKSKSTIEYGRDFYTELSILEDYHNFMYNFSAAMLGEEYDFSSFTDQQPEYSSDGIYSVAVSDEELMNACDVTFVAWQFVDEIESGIYYYLKLGENYDVYTDGNTVYTDKEIQWHCLNEEPVCLDALEFTDEVQRYSTPAKLNGEDVEIVIVFDAEHPEGIVAGAKPINDDNQMATRELTEIKPGDKIIIICKAELFSDDNANEEHLKQYPESVDIEGDPFIVPKEGLTVWSMDVDEGDFLYGFAIYDVSYNVHYTDFGTRNY